MLSWRQSGRPMRRRAAALLLVWLGLLIAAGPVLAQSTPPGAVVLLKVQGVIDPVVAQYVEQGIHDAAADGARLVVIQLDTPGGLDSAMRTIVQSILNSGVPVVVYVAPSGARAASAGVFIAAAAHVAAMAPGTNIGAAHPVEISQTEMSETMTDKVTNDAVAYLRAIAEQRNRNADLADRLVRQSESLTAQQAVEDKLVDLVAVDLRSLLIALDGRQVTVAGNRVTLELAGAPIEERPMNWLQVVTHSIVDPNIAYILLSIGTIALAAEFWNPGAIIPGVIGSICLVLAFVALGSLPVNYGGVALIMLAIIFFLLDIKVAGFGLTIAGVVSFVIGSLLLFSPLSPPTPAAPQLAVNLWLLAGTTALLVLFFGGILTAGLRAQWRPDAMRLSVPAGAVGVVTSTLAPQGTVQLRSELWTAVAVEGPIRVGESVEVVEMVDGEGLRLLVRRRAGH